MPKGPKGEKRPADVIGAAVMVAKIATGEEPEDYGSKPEKNQAAAELARKGGRARAQGLSAKRRIEIAKRAAQKKVAKGLIELRLPVENVLCLGTAGERCTRQKGGDRGSLPDMGCKSGF